MELKFKAYHKTRKIILPVIKIEWFNEKMFKVTVEGSPEQGQYIWLHHEIVLMQYTGRVDKNGQEIFQGHVVKDSLQHEKLWKIEYRVDSEYVGFIPVEIETNYISQFVSWKNMEIIGDIYQNPELLN